MPRPQIGRKNFSIGLFLTDAEIEAMKAQMKQLRLKHHYSRNEVMREVLTKLLSDDDFIHLVRVKTGLKEKKLKYKQRKAPE